MPGFFKSWTSKETVRNTAKNVVEGSGAAVFNYGLCNMVCSIIPGAVNAMTSIPTFIGGGLKAAGAPVVSKVLMPISNKLLLEDAKERDAIHWLGQRGIAWNTMMTTGTYCVGMIISGASGDYSSMSSNPAVQYICEVAVGASVYWTLDRLAIAAARTHAEANEPAPDRLGNERTRKTKLAEKMKMFGKYLANTDAEHNNRLRLDDEHENSGIFSSVKSAFGFNQERE